MNYRILFFIVGISLFLMGSVLFFVVSSGAKTVQTHALDQAAQSSLESDFIRKGLFALGEITYAQTPPVCAAPFVDDAYATLAMHYHNPPRSCELFVNGRLELVERNLRPSCVGECPNEEFYRTLHVGLLDVRDNHDVRVCCNDVCISTSVKAAC